MTKNRENRMSKGRNTNSIKWMSFEFQFWEVTAGSGHNPVDLSSELEQLRQLKLAV